MIEITAAKIGAWLDAPVIPLAGKRPVPALGSWGRFIGEHFQGLQETLSLPWSQADGYGIVIPPGVVVLDLDVDDAGTLATAKATLMAAGLHEAASRCRYWTRTKSGGRHLFFDAGEMNTEALPASLGPKVEIKRTGHYVVGPGSAGYQWGGRAFNEASAEPLSPFPFLFAAS